MADNKKIKTALISVFHKDGLEALLKKLNDEGVKFLSTGGTQTFIESLGYQCEKVENVTTYPSILGGRVKTLHPKVSEVFWADVSWRATVSRWLSMRFPRLTSLWSICIPSSRP